MVNDSLYLAGTAIFHGGSSNYIGVAGYYFNFTQGGSLYIKEGNYLDTATYSFTTTNQVKPVFFSFDNMRFGPGGATRGNFTITNLTANAVTLTLPEIITPDGAEFEVINLKK